MPPRGNYFASRNFQARRTNTRPGAQNAASSIVVRPDNPLMAQTAAAVVAPIVSVAMDPVVIDLTNRALDVLTEYISDSVEAISEMVFSPQASPSLASIAEDGVVEWHETPGLMELPTTPNRPEYVVEEPNDDSIVQLEEGEMRSIERTGPTKRAFDEIDFVEDEPTEPNLDGKRKKHYSLSDLENQGGGPQLWTDLRVACTTFGELPYEE